jgi:LemA protein
MWWLWLLMALSVIYIVYMISLFNRLVRHRNNVDNAWHRIDVELNRRADLIPNLAETVKGYAEHEKETFEMAAKARAAVLDASTVGQSARAESMAGHALRSLLALAESYPELKANQGFLSLQAELAETENKVAAARQYYNDAVMRYDITRQKFPSNVVASAFGFTEEREYFEPVTPDAPKPPGVSF